MKILIVGFGNVLLGDDGFGVEVLKRLETASLPPTVEVLEVGISGFDLVLRLMGGYDELVVVDTVQRGGTPGTLHVFSPSAADLDGASLERLDPHLAEPTRAMKMARRLEVLPARVTVVACEPRACRVGIGMSRPVRECVPAAVETIGRIVESADRSLRECRVG